jgi:hypothetical protein
MPPISDLRSDSPLIFICVAGSDLGASEHPNRGWVFRVVAIVRFCCHSEVFWFHDPWSIHNPLSYTRSCLQRHRSPYVSASSDLRRTGVTAAIKLSLEPTQRHSLSARSFTLAGSEPGVALNTVEQLFARVPSSPRGIVSENNGARVRVLSGTKSVAQGFSSAGVSHFTTRHSLVSRRLWVSIERDTGVRKVAPRWSTLRGRIRL